MKGKVLANATESAAGLISGDDGKRYRFEATSVRNGYIRSGQEVDFDILGGAAVEIYGVSGAYAITPDIKRGWFTFYLSPTGRVSRRQYWLYGVLATFAATLVLGWIPVVGQILGLAAFWSSIALSIKRCHDVGRSGWWSLLPSLAIALTIAVAIAEAAGRTGMTVTGLLVLCSLACVAWLFVTVYVRRGEPGPNRFGPDPFGLPIA